MCRNFLFLQLIYIYFMITLYSQLSNYIYYILVGNQKSLSVFELIRNGGLSAQLIVLLLFGLLVFAVYIYIERFLAINDAKNIEKGFFEKIKNEIKKNKVTSAKNMCEKLNKPLGKILYKGISNLGRPIDVISQSIENAAKQEIYNLEKNVSVLATISGVAPMIGFLGTVIGMIMSIFEIANSGGQIDIKLLADGLYTAMTTTVAGLIVGIVGYVTYNHLVTKTNAVVHQMEVASIEFMELVND